jgi:hypothetical protein
MELAPVPRIDAEVNDTIDLVNQMVRQAQSGDAGAFEGVYRTHVGRIHSLCLRMSGDAAGTLQREVSFRRISGRMIVVANERSAGGFADDAVLDEPAVLDQVQAQAARQRAASGVAPEVACRREREGSGSRTARGDGAALRAATCFLAFQFGA